jgi:hypothetical protein
MYLLYIYGTYVLISYIKGCIIHPQNHVYSGYISLYYTRLLLLLLLSFFLLPRTLVIYIHTGKLKIKNVTERISIIPYIQYTCISTYFICIIPFAEYAHVRPKCIFSAVNKLHLLGKE